MKKKIIFMAINMNVGGTEKALLNMISEITNSEYEVTILMLEKYGDFLNHIQSNVHVKFLKRYNDIKDELNNPPKLTAFKHFKRGKFIKCFNIIVAHLISKVLKNRSVYFKYILGKYPVIDEEYDIAVAYAGPMDFISYFVIKKIKAKKKIQWIHFDITKIGFDKNFASKIYKKFDKIFVVSNDARNRLVETLPSIKDKTEVFYNLVSSKEIKDQANRGKGFVDDFDGIRIVTVGRLTNEKGQDLAIKVLKRLIEDGNKVKWYCIGEGNSRKWYEKLVEEYELTNNFHFLGTNPNPYPYMKQCDIYVQPSRHEGYCITLAEAKCLHRPIVTTNFTGSAEQIINGETGLIVSIDENEIYKAVKNLIKNRKLRKELTDNLARENFETRYDLSKLFVMEG